ncbi:Retrovirus-related Pol polyprotein from type-1 retrotransposable element [Trichinella pseudospiralis]|uniref:Retrovirus-related Pol polyprotein from type-1 retrotransposable element n=1 Tax=Trichinella pseudospiralis TaxID=6337 RepID=A0A0V1GSQ4_TRIPS|nr:Retrovirus-related Pol polyprotein from type-1 retrotransposable element [Trichinella pseudospiralis]
MLESIVSRHNEPSSPKASRLQRKIPGKGGRGQVRQRSAATQNPAWLNSASAVQKAYNSAPARTVNAILRRPNACPSFTATQVANHYFNLRPAVTSLAPEVVDILPPPATDHSMLVAELSESEVWEKMQKAPNSAPGADRINIRMLRAADPGALILTRFYRCCLMKKWVPLQWKQSVCKLLYKDGDKERLANWRPIALEPVLQRVISAVVASRMTSWARANGLISLEAQKGFQPADGTSEHNFVMEVAIQEARRTNAQLAISWLDISNAFGTVSHQVVDILPPPATDHSMLVAELSESEVWEKMQKAPNSAPGADRINIRMLRAADPGALILTRFYRCCLMKKWVPLQWKQSVCKLLYKDGDKERLANWRPIALEPVLQRVISAVVASRMTSWARANGLISLEAQKGFQPADGTSEYLSN